MANLLHYNFKSLKQLFSTKQSILVGVLLFFFIVLLVLFCYLQINNQQKINETLGPVGDFVGGIGGAIIGIISILLLIQTLQKQIESNRHDQIIDHENVLRNLINDLYDEIYNKINALPLYDENNDNNELIYTQVALSKIILKDQNIEIFETNYNNIVKNRIDENNKKQFVFFNTYYELEFKKLYYHYFLIIKYIYDNIKDDVNAIQRIVLYLKNKIHNEILDQLNLAISLDKSNSELFEFALEKISDKYNVALYLIPKIEKIEIDFEIEKSNDTYKFIKCDPFLHFQIPQNENIKLNSFQIQIEKMAWEHKFINQRPLSSSYNNIIVKVNDIIDSNNINNEDFIALQITYSNKTYEIYSKNLNFNKSKIPTNHLTNIDNKKRNLLKRSSPQNRNE